MLKLSRKFKFSLNDCGAWPTSVYKTNYKNKGVLNPEWTFYLHGAHCSFENIRTGQIVEVRYTEKPEFGCLDGFFFFKYMQTTERFTDLAVWFADSSNVYVAIKILSEYGVLTKKAGVGSYSYILAI